MAIRTAHGSTLVESIVLLMVFTIVLTLGLSRASLMLAKAWLSHALYQNLRCELQVGGTACKAELFRSSHLLSWGHILSFESRTSYNSRFHKIARGEIRWCNTRENSTCKRNETLHITSELRESALRALR